MTVVPPWSLAGRLAVITGFGAGIGRATATAFARAGARIAGLDIDAQYGERAARELGAEGAEAVFISCDTGDAGAIESAFATIADTIGPVDILVNNAGAGSHTRPEDLSLAEWEHVMAVSITGYAMAAREAGRAMIGRDAAGASSTSARSPGSARWGGATSPTAWPRQESTSSPVSSPWNGPDTAFASMRSRPARCARKRSARC